MPKPRSFIGQQFGRLKVLSEAAPRITSRGTPARRVLCLCSCGKQKIVQVQYLLCGDTKSCGCIKIDRCKSGVMRLRHGYCRKDCKSGIHAVWWSMYQRCYDQNCPAYPRYGGRGIKVCDSWKIFENFLKDMGEPPPGMSIERINNDGNYEPLNCKWATRFEQGRNKRNNRRFTVFGVTGCAAELCRKFGITENRFYARLRYGWTPEDAFTKPLMTHVQRLRVQGRFAPKTQLPPTQMSGFPQAVQQTLPYQC